MSNSYKVGFGLTQVVVKILPSTNNQSMRVKFINVFSRDSAVFRFDAEIGMSGMVKQFILDNGIEYTHGYMTTGGEFDYIIFRHNAPMMYHKDSGLWY